MSLSFKYVHTLTEFNGLFDDINEYGIRQIEHLTLTGYIEVSDGESTYKIHTVYSNNASNTDCIDMVHTIYSDTLLLDLLKFDEHNLRDYELYNDEDIMNDIDNLLCEFSEYYPIIKDLTDLYDLYVFVQNNKPRYIDYRINQ